ncbi:MAG: hypothetical protein JST85_22900 [Acidobacteria bacterium]|nr:hypothetical protein [Acidobacteriota bacterium]
MALQDELKIVWVKDRASVPYLTEVSLRLAKRNGLPELPLPWEIIAYAELRADAMPEPDGRYGRRVWFRPEEAVNEAEDFPLTAVNPRFIVKATPSLRLARIDWLGRNVTGADVPL